LSSFFVIDNKRFCMSQKATHSWFVYIIRTLDGQLYTGITTDIQRRWQQHLSGKAGARYFRTRKPHLLALLETHPDRSSASKREAAIKKLSKPEKEQLVSNNPPSITLQFEPSAHVQA
jgi:putative endonuclease